MIHRSHGIFVGTGSLLIVLVNAAILAGVARNRAAPPLSEFALTEREIAPSPEWGLDNDNSGLDISLSIRTPGAAESALPSGFDGPVFGWGDAPWLTSDKLKALGFRISDDKSEAGKRHDQKLLPKDVYVVLEFNGPGYQTSLRQAGEKASRAAEAAAADPADRKLQIDARYSQKLAESTRDQETRLYCVDAGLDPDALRRVYRDPFIYAVVRGTIRPSVVERQGSWRVVGRLSGVRIDNINVPLSYRSVFAGIKRFNYRAGIPEGISGLAPDQSTSRHYTVTVDWGRRLEPWIVRAAPVGASPP